MSLPTLGTRLQQARKRKKLSQTDVATLLQMDASTISKCERYNAIHWTLFKLIQLTSIYHVSLFEILVHGSFKNIPITEGGRVILVDDESTQLLIYQKYLAAALPRTTIITFKCPLAALAWLQTNTARLVITDHHMPKLNGGELLVKISQLETNRNTPTILMTDKAQKTAIRKIAKEENALFFDKEQPKSAFLTTVTDLLKIV